MPEHISPTSQFKDKMKIEGRHGYIEGTPMNPQRIQQIAREAADKIRNRVRFLPKIEAHIEDAITTALAEQDAEYENTYDLTTDNLRSLPTNNGDNGEPDGLASKPEAAAEEWTFIELPRRDVDGAAYVELSTGTIVPLHVASQLCADHHASLKQLRQRIAELEEEDRNCELMAEQIAKVLETGYGRFGFRDEQDPRFRINHSADELARLRESVRVMREALESLREEFAHQIMQFDDGDIAACDYITNALATADKGRQS